MKTCFVSTPFGRKQDALGRTIDFDRVYADLLRPVLEAAGVSVSRADEVTGSAVLHRSVFAAVLGSDLMVADISAANANVMYEVGLRHASRRGATVLVMAGGLTIPFDLTLGRVHTYALDADGSPDPGQADSFRHRLGTVVQEALTRVTSDSPVFEFFPEMHVELPQELAGGTAPRPRPRAANRRPPPVPNQSPTEQVRQVEADLRSAGTDNAFDYISLLRQYRDHSAWDDLIHAAESMPPEATAAPEAVHLVALALNRRGQPGDRERAIAMTRQLIAETGGSGETYGILGRIYKDQFEEHRSAGETEAAARSLDAAIDAYRSGFEIEPSDYYPGVNAVTMLMHRGTDAAKAEARALVPRVRQAIHQRMRDGTGSYWELASELELCVIEGSWDDAARMVERISATEPGAWMLQSTARQLRMLGELSDNPSAVTALVTRLEADARVATERR